MTVELLDCPNPWCEAAERDGDYSPAVRLHHFGDYRVVCTSCMTEGPLRPTKEEAIAAWNARSALEGVAGLVEALVISDKALRSHFIGRGTKGGSCDICHSKWMGDAEVHGENCLIDLNRTALATFRDQGGRS